MSRLANIEEARKIAWQNVTFKPGQRISLGESVLFIKQQMDRTTGLSPLKEERTCCYCGGQTVTRSCEHCGASRLEAKA